MRLKRFLGVLLVFLSLIMMLFAGSPKASAATVLNIDFTDMNFASPTLISGTSGQVDAVYRYENIITVNGVTLDALVTITQRVNAGLQTLDKDNAASLNRFEPEISATAAGEGYFNFEFLFVADDTITPVMIGNFYLTGIDVDGSGYREYYEISGYSNYITNAATGITVLAGSEGRTRFLGINSNLAGISFEDTAAFIAEYQAPVSTFNLVLGCTSSTSSQYRQFSVNFGAEVDEGFTTPVETENPQKPTVTVTIDDGGDGVINGNESADAVGLSGIASSDCVGQVVTLRATDGTAILYFSAIVDASYNYATTADLSSLNNGIITAYADVTDSYGNPADTAADTTNKQKADAIDDSIITDEDVAVDVTVTGNDINPGTSDLVVTVESGDGPANGSVSISGGVITYTPNLNFNGLDTFVYTITDENGGTDTATVDITVTSVNDAPIAVDDDFTVSEDGSLSDTVKGNDTNGEGTNTVSLASDVSHGDLTLYADGTFTYEPDPDYTGSDSFTYTITDGDGDESGVATVDITVTSENDPPIVGTTLTADNPTSTTADVTFDEATDDVSAAGDLTYLVYYSENPADLASLTVINAPASSAVAFGAPTVYGTGFITVTGLNPSTIYYFTVVVEDESGNQSVYNSDDETTLEVPESIQITPDYALIEVGGSVDLDIIYAPETANHDTVTWSSSNPSVATINADGIVTGVEVGRVIITAVSGDHSDTSIVEVESIVPDDPAAATIRVEGDLMYITDETPIPGVEITLYSTPIRDTTDANGEFDLGLAQEGSHTLIAETSPGVEIGRITVNITRGTVESYTLYGDGSLDIVFNETTRVIYIRLTIPRSNPAAGVGVREPQPDGVIFDPTENGQVPIPQTGDDRSMLEVWWTMLTNYVKRIFIN